MMVKPKRRDGESPLEYQKRMYRTLMSLDEICGFERDADGLVVRWHPLRARALKGEG
jgi:hypothetical protein